MNMKVRIFHKGGRENELIRKGQISLKNGSGLLQVTHRKCENCFKI